MVKKPGWTLELLELVRSGKIKSVKQGVSWFKQQAGRPPRPGEFQNIIRIVKSGKL